MVTRPDPATGGAIMSSVVREAIERSLRDLSTGILHSALSAVPKTASTAKVNGWNHPSYGTPMTSPSGRGMALGGGFVYCFTCHEVHPPFTGAWIEDME